MEKPASSFTKRFFDGDDGLVADIGGDGRLREDLMAKLMSAEPMDSKGVSDSDVRDGAISFHHEIREEGSASILHNLASAESSEEFFKKEMTFNGIVIAFRDKVREIGVEEIFIIWEAKRVSFKEFITDKHFHISEEFSEFRSKEAVLRAAREEGRGRGELFLFRDASVIFGQEVSDAQEGMGVKFRANLVKGEEESLGVVIMDDFRAHIMGNFFN